jgi:hypothetical protein
VHSFYRLLLMNSPLRPLFAGHFIERTDESTTVLVVCCGLRRTRMCVTHEWRARQRGHRSATPDADLLDFAHTQTTL